MAPEVLTGYYGKECDIWSLGVCIYYLLTGSLPFKSKTPIRMFQKINGGLFEIPDQLSKPCINFLKCTICPDPESRLTAD
jgi:serine/threonine protein kinase